jgi:hypothetical protein
MRYYPSTCPVCEETALAADVMMRTVEFQCARCGVYEITAAARSAMRAMSSERRVLWLSQARKQTSCPQRIALTICANEDPIGRE